MRGRVVTNTTKTSGQSLTAKKRNKACHFKIFGITRYGPDEFGLSVGPNNVSMRVLSHYDTSFFFKMWIFWFFLIALKIIVFWLTFYVKY